MITVLRPITLGFILAAAVSSGKEINWGAYDIIAFLVALYLLKKEKVVSIAIVFIFGAIGILMALF